MISRALSLIFKAQSTSHFRGICLWHSADQIATGLTSSIRERRPNRTAEFGQRRIGCLKGAAEGRTWLSAVACGGFPRANLRTVRDNSCEPIFSAKMAVAVSTYWTKDERPSGLERARPPRVALRLTRASILVTVEGAQRDQNSARGCVCSGPYQP